jgi:non-homologous end joining protein Ku
MLATWRGFLRLALVYCPIYLSPATLWHTEVIAVALVVSFTSLLKH